MTPPADLSFLLLASAGIAVPSFPLSRVPRHQQLGLPPSQALLVAAALATEDLVPRQGLQIGFMFSVIMFDWFSASIHMTEQTKQATAVIPYQTNYGQVLVERNLVEFDRNFGSNQFSGIVPYSISKMVALKNLNLAHNQLQGNLTDVFGGLGNLTTMSVFIPLVYKMNPVDPTTENEVPLSNVNHEVPQISEVNNEVPQDQPNMTSVAADASPSTDATPSAIGTRKLTSDVWNHFRRKKINGMDKAICNYCEKPLSGNSKHGTTHLREHFKICPRRTVSDIRQKILIKEKNKGDFVIKGFQFDQEASRCMLAEMIILHEYPLTIVEHHGFRKLLASLQPLFKVPCRNTIKSDILKLYDYEKTKVLSLLECNRATSSQETKAYYSSIEYDEDTIDVDGLEMVEECLSQDMDMSGLLLLYSSPGENRKVKMGHGVSCGGGQSSLGYLFGSGEAPKSAGESAEPVQKPAFKSTGEPAEPLQKPTPATQVDNKQIPTGIQGNLANNYQ
ncbi:hypothetical protein ZIOFF_044955 [Zingiber officinale]|uniref:BED-type domain-containing protein n=1 Tax=Zingiber officinale TaxID=94328 RepID=A0A8J5G320_ZINOF|nr:hypothetical protein ZIOFF_044955 [Zingiber officinale]